METAHSGSKAASAMIDNAYFKDMLDFVPAVFYFDVETKEKLVSHPDTKNKDNGHNNKGKKRPSSELSFRSQAKYAKYDPEQMRTVTRVQDMLLRKEEDSKIKKKGRKKKHVQDIEELRSTVENAEDLREKLQAKIELLRVKRKGLNNLDRKRLSRKESKLKLKMRRQEQKKSKQANKDGSHKGSLQNGGVLPKQASPPPGKPIFNKEGKMVFSKFDFSESHDKEKKGEGSSKNFKKLLEKVEKEKADLKRLKEQDIDAAHSAQQKSAWKKALQKAEGVKVRDDPELLKKTIKKHEKQKKKTKQEWAERKEMVDQKMKERQDKRQKNIKARKQSNIDTKIKKAKKKGRIMPGF